jgi:hypothetical protein
VLDGPHKERGLCPVCRVCTVEESPVGIEKGQGAMGGTSFDIAEAALWLFVRGVKDPNWRVLEAGGGVQKGGGHALVVQEKNLRGRRAR